MIGAFLAAAFQNDAFFIGGEANTWGLSGGVEKRKNKLKKNERPVIEQAISEAIDKVTGVKPVAVDQVKSTPKETPVYTFDTTHLEQRALELGQTIEDYKTALMLAERDDEETLLLLL